MPHSIQTADSGFSLRRVVVLAALCATVGAGCSTTADTSAPGARTDSGVAEMPSANEGRAPAERDAALIPLDPNVRIGTLDNGLTYYIRHNDRPADRAELRLAVNAGSILENDEQLGLAHFVEHMAFNGTERFHKQELIDYLESTGVQFGADLNAYTSFDETVYMLQVPTDSIGLLDTGIEILREWSSRVSFEPDEIEKERGVVIEEWRLGRGASARIRDKELPVMLAGSRYPDRLPIGTKENLETFDPVALRKFYADWYRPDLMAVVVVGAVDVDLVERLIRDQFSDLERRSDAPDRPTFKIPQHDETLVSVVADPEASVKSVSVLYKADDPNAGNRHATTDVMRESLLEALYMNMFNDRLRERTQSDDPPFFGAGVGFGSFGRSKKLLSLTAIPGQRGFDAALGAVVEEAERIRRFGFAETELERARADLLRSYEIAWSERDKTESSRYAREYVGNFLDAEPIPGIEWEHEYAAAVLPSLSTADVNAVGLDLISDGSRVLLVSGPEVDGDPLPDPSSLLKVLDEVESTDIQPYVDSVESGNLVDPLPTAGAIASETVDDATGIHHLVLSNGANVYFKSTDFKNDQLLMSASSPGGTSLVDDQWDVAADFASTLVAQSGVGEFGPTALQKKLAGKAVRVTPSITERREVIGGAASPADMETMFQLTYLYFTEPRLDSTAYRSFVSRYRSLLENIDVDPNRAFSDTLSVTLAQNNFRRRPVTLATLDELNERKSIEIFRDRFADAGDFTFVFVGAFDPVELKSNIERYVASLPSSGRVEEARDLGIRPPEGHVTRTLVRGSEPKSRVQLVITGAANYSNEARRMVRVIQELLDIRLREVLREDKGGTYGVSIAGSVSDEPVEAFQFSIGFGCSPDRVDELVQTTLSELDRFVADGPDPEDIHKVVETITRQHEVGLRQNEYWLSAIQYYADQGVDFSEILAGGHDFYAALTPEQIRLEATRYLDRSNLITLVMNPETDTQ